MGFLPTKIMKWTIQLKRQLRATWKEKTDKELSRDFSVSARSIRRARSTLGLDRNRLDDKFVVQVTEWLPTQADTDCQCAHFRKCGTEHIVAKESERYAIFRPATEFVAGGIEPAKGTWVLHWRPTE